MIIDPNNFEGFNRILTGIVVPRPIALVSSVSREGIVNLAPFSFFNAVSYQPAMLVVSIARSAGWKDKDTLSNIEATGEFVVNVVVEDIAEAMNSTAAEFPSDINEFEVANLTPVAAEYVTPPLVYESPANFECRLKQVVDIGDGDHQYGLVIGSIIAAHIRDELIQGHRINHELLKPVGRLAGNLYCKTDDTYQLVRPTYDAP